MERLVAGAEHGGLVRPVRVDPTGRRGPTPMQARGPRWRRTSRGLYVPADVPTDSVEQRILEASAAIPDGALTGWGALRWMGAGWLAGSAPDGGPRPVTVACRRKHSPQPGIDVSQEGWWPEDEESVEDGVRVTAAVRAACFEMRTAPSLSAAVVALDMSCYADLVSIDEVERFLRRNGPRTGIEQARRAVALADENSWSPQETRTRLVWRRHAELPPVVCNRPVFDDRGRHLGTPDLLEPVAGVVVEYDGALHLQAPQRHRDRRREEAFRDAGLEHLTVVAGELATDAVARMRAAHDRASRRGPSGASWTLQRPAWWQPTHTVELRRALDADLRARLLAYRTAG